MQKNSSIIYSKLSVSIKSKGRLHKEKRSILRSPFQRDRDRIIHSTAFRRLKHKTQVFVNTEGDHYRTRITHSLEVSQISRTLAKYFGLNEDLCETLSLSHDLGHAPFGHAGEETLNECMKNKGGFDHNIQTLRIVTFLENKYYNFNGLNLTIETLDGLVKHNGPINNLNNLNNILGKNCFKNRINFKNQPSLEAQISSISDDIAYNSHDLEDGLRAKLFKIDDLVGIPIITEIIKKNKRSINKINSEMYIRQIIRDIINEMVTDIISNVKNNIKKYKIYKVNDIYRLNKQIVCFSKNMNIFDTKIKEFLRRKMYYSKDVLKKTNYGKKVIKFLFFKIKKNPNKFINNKMNKDYTSDRAISDFIAGMTDRYAIKLYKSLK